MAKTKYYVVWKGHNPGIYSSWSECELQIKGFTGALYKSFPTQRDATTAFRKGAYSHFGSKQNSSSTKTSDVTSSRPVWESISVDAACSGNPGIMEYRGVNTKTGKELFRQGPFSQGTNNIGEFLALIHGLAFLKQRNSSLPLYTDSKTALSWLMKRKVKTTLEKSDTNAILFDMMDRALKWIETNSYPNSILKWDTKNWGEIPADFGRK